MRHIRRPTTPTFPCGPMRQGQSTTRVQSTRTTTTPLTCGRASAAKARSLRTWGWEAGGGAAVGRLGGADVCAAGGAAVADGPGAVEAGAVAARLGAGRLADLGEHRQLVDLAHVLRCIKGVSLYYLLISAHKTRINRLNMASCTSICRKGKDVAGGLLHGWRGDEPLGSLYVVLQGRRHGAVAAAHIARPRQRPLHVVHKGVVEGLEGAGLQGGGDARCGGV